MYTSVPKRGSNGRDHDSASKGFLLVVVTFLLIVLIYSSITEVDIFAKPKASYQCFTTTKGSGFYSEVCCQFINGNPIGCSQCWYDADGNAVGSCYNWTPKTGQPVMGNSTAPAGTLLPPSGNNTSGVTNGQTGPPNRLGTLLPSGSNNDTGTPPALTVTKEHNTASPNVLSSTENSNPSTSTGQGEQSLGHHHHKGEQNGGGTSSTGNTQSGSTNNNPSSEGNNNRKSDNSNGKK